MKIDLYFSYRSPYSYLILPRMLKLKEKYDIEINFKVVYPHFKGIRSRETWEGDIMTCLVYSSDAADDP